MQNDLVGLLLLIASTVGPAAVVLVMAVRRDRNRGKIHRQRITKGQKRRHEK